MPSAQRSILSFFQSTSSSSSSSSSAAASSDPSPSSFKPPPPPRSAFQSTIAVPPPPPPPPPPPSLASRFVPPPPRPGHGPTTVTAPAGTVLRSGGSSAPNLALPPLPPGVGRAVLLAAGATAVPSAAGGNDDDEDDEDDDVVDFTFPPPSAARKASSPGDDAHSVRIVLPQPHHVPGLVSVNAILLSARYPDAFYQRVADRTHGVASALFNRIILGDDGCVVGGFVCRLEPSPFGPPAEAPRPPLAVYIQSLALLSPYRAHGWAAAALDSVVQTARALNAAASSSSPAILACGVIRSVYAHVWTESDEALRWYEARGFVRHGGAPVANYYFALRPNTAWMVRLDLDTAPAHEEQPKTQPVSTATGSAAVVPADSGRPPLGGSSRSYQKTRPATDWNDLPEDMVVASGVASTPSSATASAATSRNASRIRLAATGATNGQGTVNDANRVASDPSSSSSSSSSSAAPASFLGPPTTNTAMATTTGNGGSGSSSSSRSSSTARKKRERTYPAAMFQ
ncbi:gcn5-related n-acetyltransferase [Niveomyces insectorum RCEF 264]|uniref:Gcn5-related n-acetyltransferase n=1 Tax=Niveomyces insectorum RCEF 264 TaxID=1081102 RepID=A0A162J1K8_9HYPO|nr:gcn5-related n-acetyltransferase [Niveomyces insectorum RCEF 264]